MVKRRRQQQEVTRWEPRGRAVQVPHVVKQQVLRDHARRLDATGEVHIIIDEARLFGADPAYRTLAALKAYVLDRRPHATIEVELDSIRVTHGAGPGPAWSGGRPIGSDRH